MKPPLFMLYYKKHWDAPVWLHEAVDIPDVLKPYVQDIKINLFEIAFLKEEELNYFHSDFRIVADYFIQKQKTNDYNPKPEKLEHVEAVLQLLSIMTGDTRFEDILNNEETDTREGGVHTMCDVLDRIEARGEIIGVIKLYRDEMNLTPTEIIKKIMLRFGLEKEEAEDYVEKTLGLELV